MHLLSLEHLVELSLAPRQQKLSEVHLSAIWVIKLLEEADTELDVQVKVGCLCGALHEDDLHQLLEQGWVIVKVVHQLVLDFVEVFL